MEKVKCICMMRDLMKSITELEEQLMCRFNLSLNEAMLLCSVGDEKITATSISDRTGMKPSHVSKIINSLEKQNLLIRHLGEMDRRQMYISLTSNGLDKLKLLRVYDFDIPKLLVPLTEAYGIK